MTEVAFYHLTRSTLEQTLPKLLEKTLAAGKRAVVLAGSAERVEHLNNTLWTFDPNAWLPHGSAKDGDAEEQPVWLTDSPENPNGAQYLFLTDGTEHGTMTGFERCFELFDGASADALAKARAHWSSYRDLGLNLTYWQQTENGGWRKKNA